jgi:hypothetical protein
MRRRTVTAFAVVLAVVGIAAPAFAHQEPRLPTELWEQYPLEPAVGEEGQQPRTTAGAPTETEPVPATETASTTEPGANRQVARAPVADDEDGSIALLLAAGLGGLGLLLAGEALFVARRRKGSSDVEGGPSPTPPPQPSLRRRLSSESGPPAPFADRAPPRTAKVSTGKNPPPGKDLPRLDPPPEKRRVRSGLPPGRAIPANPEGAKSPPRAAAAPASKNRPRPATEQEPERPHELVLEPPPTPPRAARPLRAVGNEHGRAEECVIEWWRGYFTSDFYAVSMAPDGRTHAAARSRSFPWQRSEPPPPTGVAAEAHADLVADLAAEGWEEASGGTPWYRTRLRRALRPTLRDLADDPR